MVTRKGGSPWKLFALICTVVTPSLSWGLRMHFLHVRYFTLSHHGRHNSQISNPPPPTGARVASTFLPLGIVFDPHTRNNY